MSNNRYIVEFNTGLSAEGISAISNAVNTSMTSNDSDWYDVEDIMDAISSNELVLTDVDNNLLDKIRNDGVGYIEV